MSLLKLNKGLAGSGCCLAICDRCGDGHHIRFGHHITRLHVGSSRDRLGPVTALVFSHHRSVAREITDEIRHCLHTKDNDASP